MKLNVKPKRKEGRAWPNYILWGRVRTSTAALLIAFIGIWWLYATYHPPAENPEVPATQVVPPGFIPDPSYTWVPRTEVQRRTTTTTTTPTTTETTTTSPGESTTPSESPTSPTTSPTSPVTTTPTLTSPAPPSAPTPSPVPGQGPMSTPAAPTQ